MLVAAGITATGQREVLGIEVGDSDDQKFWTAFLLRLLVRGLGCAAGDQRCLRRSQESHYPLLATNDLAALPF